MLRGYLTAAAGLGLAALALIAGPQSPALAESAAKAVTGTGVIKVPGYDLPPSVYLSAEARRLLEQGPNPLFVGGMPPPEAIPGVRAGMKKGMAPLVAKLTAVYQVTVTETTVGGIHGYWVRPKGWTLRKGAPVLLNLPAGGFMIGQANPIGLIESIPIAGLGGFEILTIDYRQAPEARFPAASEDVEKVYRELLKTHAPARIGIYGTSAGGLLTAQSLAWFQTKGLPAPGAAGILAASADGLWGGDSWHWQNPLQGKPAESSLDEELYYGGHNTADPLLSPIVSEPVLRRFPPTLLISATRAGELSSTVNTHRLLVRGGVETELHVWDGLGHAFFGLHPELPESRETFAVTVRFFAKHLKPRGKR